MAQGEGELTQSADEGTAQQGGATVSRDDDGWRCSPAALHGEGTGQIRRGTGRGEGGDTPCARNRATAHRRRRIDGGGGARAGAKGGEGNGELGFGRQWGRLGSIGAKRRRAAWSWMRTCTACGTRMADMWSLRRTCSTPLQRKSRPEI